MKRKKMSAWKMPPTKVTYLAVGLEYIEFLRELENGIPGISLLKRGRFWAKIKVEPHYGVMAVRQVAMSDVMRDLGRDVAPDDVPVSHESMIGWIWNHPRARLPGTCRTVIVENFVNIAVVDQMGEVLFARELGSLLNISQGQRPWDSVHTTEDLTVIHRKSLKGRKRGAR